MRRPFEIIILFLVFVQAHDAFEKFDVDHSGCIDAWELKEAMKALGQVREFVLSLVCIRLSVQILRPEKICTLKRIHIRSAHSNEYT